MRAFLNAILTFIAASSLTDEEFATIESSSPEYNQATYDDLSRILLARESVSTVIDRLNGYYQARGVDITAANVGRSNVLVGAVLE